MPAPIVVDYSTGRPSPAALLAAGATGVIRYLSWLYQWGGMMHPAVNPKIILPAELASLRAAGLDVTPVWEYDSRDWMLGAAGGTAHATEAVRQVRLLGWPRGTTIIGSADFDMTAGQWSMAGRGYAQAFSAGVSGAGYLPGVYGPYDVLAWCQAGGLMHTYWQAGMASAWSGSRNGVDFPAAQLIQRQRSTIGGVTCDSSAIISSEYGQWHTEGYIMQLDRIETMLRVLVENDSTLRPDGTHAPIKTPAGEYCAAGNGVKQELDWVWGQVQKPTAVQVDQAMLAAALASPAFLAAVQAADVAAVRQLLAGAVTAPAAAA